MPPMQLPLPLSYQKAEGVADFIVSDANLIAARHLAAWPNWPGLASLLLGETQSGKSHLARVFAGRTGGLLLGPGQLYSRLRAPTLVIDDLGVGVDEEGLFHMLNRVEQERIGLLLVARDKPVLWGLALPDLISRLNAIPRQTIEAPDDALMGALLLKRLRDRGLTAAPGLLNYVVDRIERSYSAIGAIVAALDAAALGAGAELSIALARRVLSTTPSSHGAEADH